MANVSIRIRGSSIPQARLVDSDLAHGVFTANVQASEAQVDALKLYITKINDGADTSTVEAAILALP